MFLDKIKFKNQESVRKVTKWQNDYGLKFDYN